MSWLLRGAASYLYYDFPDAGGRTRVRSPGESLGFAVRFSGPTITATLGPGYEVRQTKRRLASGEVLNVRERGVTIDANMFIQANALTNVSILAS